MSDRLQIAADEWAKRLDNGDDPARIEVEVTAKYGITDLEFPRVQEEAHTLSIDDG